MDDDNNSATRLHEYDAIEWSDVYRQFFPDATDEQIADAWQRFSEAKRAHEIN